MPLNLLNDGQSVYNSKMDYIRIYSGYFFTEFIQRFNSKNYLYEFLNYFKQLTIGGTKIVFDCSAECEDFNITLSETNSLYKLDWFVEYILDNNLKKNQIEIWTCDFNVKKNIPAKYSHMVRTVNQMINFVPFCHDSEFIENRSLDRKFICSMSRITKERTLMYEFIKNNNLEDSFYYSYNARILTPDKNDVDVIKLPLERYDDNIFDDSKRGEFATYRFQRKSIINIIMETFFYKEDIFGRKNNTRFFSEKTFRAISMFQPFILVSHPDMLKKLRDYGFKTFNKWWDEGYDDIQDDNERLSNIFNLILELNKLSNKELNIKYNEMFHILKHNYNHLFTIGNKFYEFHTDYCFNKIGKFEQPAINYIQNI